MTRDILCLSRIGCHTRQVEYNTQMETSSCPLGLGVLRWILALVYAFVCVLVPVHVLAQDSWLLFLSFVVFSFLVSVLVLLDILVFALSQDSFQFLLLALPSVLVPLRVPLLVLFLARFRIFVLCAAHSAHQIVAVFNLFGQVT
jgi:hypothetical protein